MDKKELTAYEWDYYKLTYGGQEAKSNSVHGGVIPVALRERLSFLSVIFLF